jgi:hypothetical protein
VQPPTEEAGLL